MGAQKMDYASVLGDMGAEELQQLTQIVTGIIEEVAPYPVGMDPDYVSHGLAVGLGLLLRMPAENIMMAEEHLDSLSEADLLVLSSTIDQYRAAANYLEAHGMDLYRGCVKAAWERRAISPETN